MPRKIKVLWVGCILIVFFSFVYFSIQGNIKAHRDKEEARVKQEFRIKKKKMAMKEVDRGQTFKVNPIKEIIDSNLSFKEKADMVEKKEAVDEIYDNSMEGKQMTDNATLYSVIIIVGFIMILLTYLK